MPLTSHHVNGLILQYLMEAGYLHSAFIFGKESLMEDANASGSHFEPGALIAIIQKGIQYQELLAQDTASGESGDTAYRTYPASQLLRASDPSALAAPTDTSSPTHSGAALHGHTNDVLAISWSSQSAVLATAAADSTARLWHMQGATSSAASPITPCDILQHHQLQSAGATVHALAWAPDGSWVATAAFDGLVRLWGVHGHLQHVLQLPGGATDAPEQVTALVASPCGLHLAAGCMNGSAGVWNVASGTLLRSRQSHAGGVLAIAWLDASSLATCGLDGAVDVLELARAPPAEGAMEGVEAAWDLQHTLRLRGHAGHVNCAAASPDGTRLCTGSDDGTARVWNVARDFAGESRQVHCLGTCSTAHTSGGGAVLQCAFRSAGPGSSGSDLPLLVATCGRCGAEPSSANVRVWDCATGQVVHEWRAGARDAVCVAWSPCGTMLAAAASDAMARVWNIESGKAVLESSMPAAVMAVAWSKEGTLAVGMSGGGVRVLHITAA